MVDGDVKEVLRANMLGARVCVMHIDDASAHPSYVHDAWNARAKEMTHPASIASFFWGRYVAKNVLNDIGADETHMDLPTGSTGEPIAPPGFGVSISHKMPYVAACAWHDTGDVAYGIDIECLKKQMSVDISRRILTDTEHGCWNKTQEQLMTVFSIKEAFYKAAFLFERRWIGFLEAEVMWNDEVPILYPLPEKIKGYATQTKCKTLCDNDVPYILSLVLCKILLE